MILTKLEELLNWVAPETEKLCVWRKLIVPEQRLCVTLSYLVTGDGHVTTAESYRISATSISRITKETTGAVWDVLLENGYLQPPKYLKIGRTYPESLKMELPPLFWCIGRKTCC